LPRTLPCPVRASVVSRAGPAGCGRNGGRSQPRIHRWRPAIWCCGGPKRNRNRQGRCGLNQELAASGPAGWAEETCDGIARERQARGERREAAVTRQSSEPTEEANVTAFFHGPLRTSLTRRLLRPCAG